MTSKRESLKVANMTHGDKIYNSSKFKHFRITNLKVYDFRIDSRSWQWFGRLWHKLPLMQEQKLFSQQSTRLKTIEKTAANTL